MLKYKLLISIILILGISLAANLGYAWWKHKQWQAGYDARVQEEAVERAQANEKISQDKIKVKHENQNRDRDQLIRLHCDHGWVRDKTQCRSLPR